MLQEHDLQRHQDVTGGDRLSGEGILNHLDLIVNGQGVASDLVERLDALLLTAVEYEPPRGLHSNQGDDGEK